MVEPFNVEQFRQQMSGQAPQGQPQIQAQQVAVPQPHMPQPYHPPQVPQPQVQPQPYQPQQAVQPQNTAPVQPMAQPYAPTQFQGQAPHMPQPQMSPQHWQPQPQQMQQPQAPIHHMPPMPAFAPPPSSGVEEMEEASKKPRFKLKRRTKVKEPKDVKAEESKADTDGVARTIKTSPRMIFMFGMATGIACFLIGNMMISNLLTDKSAKNFQDIERLNAQAQQPVLPKTVQSMDSNSKLVVP